MSAPTAERIDSQQYIRVLLEQMVGRSHLINITSKTDNRSAVSSVLRVDADGRSFLLDTPYINDDSAQSEFDSISVSGKSQGSSIQFETELMGTVKEEGLSLHRYAFPQELFYSSQRSSYRVDTRDFETLIHFSTTSGFTFNAPLCDISDGGLRVTTKKSVIKSITKGDDIFCALDIDDGSCHKLKVKLCQPSKVDDPNLIEFGATFVDLLPHQKSQISQYIATLERKLLRKQHSIPDAVPLSEQNKE
ncbi:MAG: flagellar brake protein [Gammaproteobacteria bacterium]|nr:flagellar brake protein [Gammaproteobacteria bacterium]